LGEVGLTTVLIVVATPAAITEVMLVARPNATPNTATARVDTMSRVLRSIRSMRYTETSDPSG
jgi:hypothetical protein